VTGYVIISRAFVDRINLSSLRLIRGITKYIENNDATACGGRNRAKSNLGTTTKPKSPKYSLIVEFNDNENLPPHYLKELWMPKLTGEY